MLALGSTPALAKKVAPLLVHCAAVRDAKGPAVELTLTNQGARAIWIYDGEHMPYVHLNTDQSIDIFQLINPTDALPTVTAPSAQRLLEPKEVVSWRVPLEPLETVDHWTFPEAHALHGEVTVRCSAAWDRKVIYTDYFTMPKHVVKATPIVVKVD